VTGSTAPEAITVDLAALRRRNIDHHAVDCVLPVAWLRGVLSGTDAEASEPAHVALGLHLQPRGVVVATGTLQVAFDVPCGRCLTPAPVGETARIVATFVPAASARGRSAPVAGGSEDEIDDENALGLSEDDLDTWTYEGVTLSLEAMLAEQVKLVYPMRVLCARGDDCRGLCSNCGADLNAQAPEGRTCEACGRPVPRTPVADPPSSLRPGHSAAAAARAGGPDLEPDAGVDLDPQAEPDIDRPESPLAAALKKLRS
jgi:uncharacterized metal-binding protein YceD (DUF177 family)